MAAVPQGGPFVEGEAKFLEAYDDVQRLEAFHAVPHHLRSAVHDRCWGRRPSPPCRSPGWSFPATTSGRHRPTRTTRTTRNLRAVRLLDATGRLHDGGGQPQHPEGVAQARSPRCARRSGRATVRAELDRRHDGLDWVGGDLRLGDALIFHSLTVHRALPNRGRSMRLSVDYRFQREGEALTAGCLEPHFGRLSWDDIYTGWESATTSSTTGGASGTSSRSGTTFHAIDDEDFEELLRDWLRWRRRQPDGSVPGDVAASDLVERGRAEAMQRCERATSLPRRWGQSQSSRSTSCRRSGISACRGSSPTRSTRSPRRSRRCSRRRTTTAWT